MNRGTGVARNKKFRNKDTGHNLLKVKQNSKAIPLQAWTGPEGFRRLRLSDFNTIST